MSMSDNTPKPSAADRARNMSAAAATTSRNVFDGAVRYVSRLSRATLAWVGIGLAAVLLLCTNLIVSTLTQNWRVDLTEDGLFSMTDSTRKVLAGIDEPITMRLYYSKALGDNAPSFATYFDRVKALLQRYRDLSGGKINLAFISPEPFSDAEDRAVAAGLRGVRLNSEGDQAYFGLVATNTTDNTETIGFFTPDRERFLEYDLTKLVYSLSNPKKKIVGLMSGLPIEGSPGDPQMGGRPTPPWMIVSQIREFYQVKSVGQDVTEIPPEIDTLMLVQPSDMKPETAYAIDQFALKGGRILAFIDPVAEVGRMYQRGKDVPQSTELKKLFDAWGVVYDPTKVVGDLQYARRVSYGGSGNPSATEYVAWLSLDRRSLDTGDAISAGIETLNMASVGSVSLAPNSTTKLQTLLSSSDRSATIDASSIGLRPDPVALLREFKPGGKKLTIAGRVTGDIKSAFPDGPPQAAPAASELDKKDAAAADASKGETKDAADAKASGDAKDTKDTKEAKEAKDTPKPPLPPSHVSAGRLNAIIVADTDMLHDQFWVDVREFLGQQVTIPQAHNAVFATSAIESLAGGEALTSLRARGVKPRPFQVVDEIRRDAERQFREKEQTLMAKLKDTEQKLSGLEQKSEGPEKAILSEKDRETIEKFRTEMLGIRRELRDVKLAMRQDIDRLDTTLRFVNIAGVPLLIGIGALGLAIARRRQQNR
jgi:ABC-type uncharacterized transport system involved in gliding motility auxiliary subunit